MTIAFHSTTSEKAQKILEYGLRAGITDGFTQAGSWADEIYGTRPVYLSLDPNTFKGDVVLSVDLSGIDYVADLPSLVDYGAYVSENGLYWEEGELPEPFTYLLNDGEFWFEEFLEPGPVRDAAVDTTRTLAVLEDIPSDRISVYNRLKHTIRLISGFFDKEHDWDQVLINADRKLTRGQIRDYFEKNANKIFPYLKNRDVIVILGVDTNKFVLKRNVDGGKRIHLTKLEGPDDPNSFEYWVLRRAVEFHPVIGSRTDLVWVDLDPHQDGDKQLLPRLRRNIRKILPKIKSIMKDLFRDYGIVVSAWDSGKSGYHVMGELNKKISTDKARHMLKDALDEMFEGDDVFVTGLAKKGQVRLDTTTLKNTGSIRAPYSMSISGRPKQEQVS